VLADAAVIDGSAASMFDKLPLNTPPLSAFPLCLSLQKYYDPAGLEVGLAEARSRVWRILAQLPLHLSAILNHDPGQCGSERTGLADHELELSWAGRLLSRIRGGNARPTPAEEAAMNVLLICECLTEMRPACFAARFVASTTRNVLAALETAATVFVSQLKKDPFQWTSDLLIQFRDPAQAEAWWRRREGQPMPFGFTPLTGDPRPGLLTAACRTLLGSGARIRLEASAARLEALQAGEHLWPTTDWTAARLMTLLGIPADRQSLVVASARLAGWAAQALEQQASGVSLLPALRYDVPDAPESEFPEAAAG
jgi:citrate synthase